MRSNSRVEIDKKMSKERGPCTVKRNSSQKQILFISLTSYTSNHSYLYFHKLFLPLLFYAVGISLNFTVVRQ